MQIQPYLHFDGRCEEAIEFYRCTLGAEVGALMRFKDNPAPSAQCPTSPDTENRIMHANLTVGGTTLLASDDDGGGNPLFQGFSLALTVPDRDAAERVFTALGDGGTVLQPLIATFFSPAFGMVADRFGVSWMVVVQAP